MAAVTEGQLPIRGIGRACRPASSSDHDARIAARLADATDQQLASWLAPAERRLQLVENGLAHMKASIPSLERECSAVRQNVEAVRERLAQPAA